MAVHTVYLCIGGNLGNREENLSEARMFIRFNFGDIHAVSGIYESDAWGMEGAPPFLNQVLKIETELEPKELMAEISELEHFFGRKRKQGEYLSRELDVDILFFDDLVLEGPDLAIPHPRLHLRRFVLEPLKELAPELIHPVLGKSVAALMAELIDPLQVRLLPPSKTD